jgi:hypothetical protein
MKSPFKQIPQGKIGVFLPSSMTQASKFAGSLIRGEMLASGINAITESMDYLVQ